MLNISQLKEIYGNEQVLLILISRLNFNTITKDEVADFIAAHQFNWNKFRRIARTHSVRAFLFSTITKYKIDIPAEVYNGFKKRYHTVKLKNLKQITYAADLLNRFKSRGVALIPYKGAFFAASYYPDWAARESIDIDLLMLPQDVAAVEDYLIASGQTAALTVPRTYLSYYQQFFKDIVYKVPETTGSVELHWRLTDGYAGKLPGYGFFEPHLATFRTGDFSIEKLTPTYDLLAVASNHFVKDMAMKFKYMIDMACLISKERANLDKAIIYDCAKAFHFQKRLNIGLALTGQLLGIGLDWSDAIKLNKNLLQIPLMEEIYLPRLYIDEPKYIRHALMLQDNFGQQFKFILRCIAYLFLPTSDDISNTKLPLFILALIRPFKLIWRVASRKTLR